MSFFVTGRTPVDDTVPGEIGAATAGVVAAGAVVSSAAAPGAVSAAAHTRAQTVILRGDRAGCEMCGGTGK